MNYFKKRIAVSLFLLLAIPTLVGALSMNSLIAQAAENSFENMQCGEDVYATLKNGQLLKLSISDCRQTGSEAYASNQVCLFLFLKFYKCRKYHEIKSILPFPIGYSF